MRAESVDLRTQVIIGDCRLLVSFHSTFVRGFSTAMMLCEKEARY